jgi:hypothetical protein
LVFENNANYSAKNWQNSRIKENQAIFFFLDSISLKFGPRFNRKMFFFALAAWSKNIGSGIAGTEEIGDGMWSNQAGV